MKFMKLFGKSKKSDNPLQDSNIVANIKASEERDKEKVNVNKLDVLFRQYVQDEMNKGVTKEKAEEYASRKIERKVTDFYLKHGTQIVCDFCKLGYPPLRKHKKSDGGEVYVHEACLCGK